MISALEKQGHNWTFRYYANGHQKRKTIQNCSYTEAKKMQIDFLNSLHPSGSKTVSFSAFAPKILDYVYSHFRPATRAQYKSMLNRFLSFLGDKTTWSLSLVSSELVESYIAFRRATVSAPSANSELSLLKAVFNKAVSWGYLTTTPLRNVQLLKVAKAVPRFLVNKEVALLLASTHDERIKLMFMIALHTGFRFSEVLHLRPCDVDFTKNTISVVPRADYIPKDYEHRVVPLTSELKKYFQTSKIFLKSHAPEDYILSSSMSRASYGKSIRKLIRRSFKKAKIANGRFHLLRHTFASNLVGHGANIYSVSKLLGHSNVKTTMMYAHVSPEYLDKTISCLDYGM